MNTPELLQLLDSGWLIHMHRQIDRKYLAVARRIGQDIKGVVPNLELKECDDGEMRPCRTSDGIESQCASADTPEEAVKLLAKQMFK